MTVQMYTDGEGLAPIKNVGQMYTEELTIEGIDAVLKMGVTKGDGKRWVTQDVPFTVVGLANKSPSLEGLVKAVVHYAGKIARMSDGVAMGLYLKLGKYRDDEKPKNIGSKDRAYGVVHLTNVPESDPCNPTDPDWLPLKQMNNRIYIPWLNNSVSRQDMRKAFEGVEIGEELYTIGRIRFDDTDKTAMEGSATGYVFGADIKDRQPRQTPMLETNDVSDGIEDFVFGEQHVNLEQGYDDGEHLEPPSLN